MYYILQIIQYTDTRRKNKSILEWNGTTLYFKSIEDAKTELLWRGIDKKISEQTYINIYWELTNAEKGHPVFKIRKVRAKK